MSGPLSIRDMTHLKTQWKPLGLVRLQNDFQFTLLSSSKLAIFGNLMQI